MKGLSKYKLTLSNVALLKCVLSENILIKGLFQANIDIRNIQQLTRRQYISVFLHTNLCQPNEYSPDSPPTPLVWPFQFDANEISPGT